MMTLSIILLFDLSIMEQRLIINFAEDYPTCTVWIKKYSSQPDSGDNPKRGVSFNALCLSLAFLFSFSILLLILWSTISPNIYSYLLLNRSFLCLQRYVCSSFSFWPSSSFFISCLSILFGLSLLSVCLTSLLSFLAYLSFLYVPFFIPTFLSFFLTFFVLHTFPSFLTLLTLPSVCHTVTLLSFFPNVSFVLAYCTFSFLSFDFFLSLIISYHLFRFHLLNFLRLILKFI